jgi:magnesium-transporting ATPase (P-type)
MSADTTTSGFTTAGLTEEEAARRLAERGPPRHPAASRSYASIVRHNVFTLPNTILGVVGITTVALGELADALFLGVVAANAAIGSVQEIRAKRALDRLAALVAPRARVARSGGPRLVGVDEVVVGDLILLEPGDQIVADGEVVDANALQIDESILTGESAPVTRSVGEALMSGAFAVEGAGSYVATAVGHESYAERLAGEARAFRHPPSPFQRGLNRLIVALVLLGIPLCLALSLNLWLRNTAFDEALPAVVSAVINIIPEGLILLASIVYLSGALKLSRHGALTQQLNAIESLASAAIVCFDKTGTLTEPRLRVAELVPAEGVTEAELGSALGRFAAAFPARNSTLAAIASAYPEPALAAATVPFSSRWRWSAAELGDETYVLGSPDLFELGDLAGRARREAEHGRRVVALATAAGTIADLDPGAGPPAQGRAVGLAILAEELRPQARETVGYLREEGLALLVLSGDDPATVAAIARDVGLPAGNALDGRELPDDPHELLRSIERAIVVGRIAPDGKRRVVEALRDSGRYVAMVGDGVNDVPALKASRVAIAQGGGSQMARTVADLVLVRGTFDAVPRLIAEGRQILRNMQRVSKIYATKCVFGALVVLTLGLTSLPYPFLPRQLSFASFFVTGVPPFFLALAASSGPWRMASYLRDTLRFAVPAAFALVTGVATSYVLAHEVLDRDVVASRTVALSVYVLASLYITFALEATDRRRAGWVGGMCLILTAVYALSFAIAPLRDLFELALPDGAEVGLIALGIGLTMVVLTVAGIRPGGRSDRRAGRDPAPTRRSATGT